jgi:pentatricopeptide repeat protein
MQKQRWYVADNGIYSKLISVMGRKGQIRMAMWLFSQMRNSGCKPDTSVYNALIGAHLHSRDKSKALVKALGYFDKMKGIERCQPNIVTYNILLRACARASDTKQVDILFKDLDESPVSPDIYTYNGVIDGYGKNGMIKEMESVLVRMKSKQCRPDVITFNILIDSYGRKQTFDKMEQVFKSLLRSKEKPTHPTFNSMITNYGKARLREKAESVVEKMEELGFKPNYVTQECLITLYAYCDCVSKAQQIFDELVSTQSTVPLSSLNAMLDAYCMNRLPMEADRLLDTAIEKGVVPGASTYKLLYKAYTRANDKMLVQKLLQRMNKQGIVPNKKFFLDALEAFGNSANRPRRVQTPNPAREPSRDSASNSGIARSSKQKLTALEAVSATEKKARILPNSNSAIKPGYYPTAIKPDTGVESNLETAISSKPEFSFSQEVS